MKLLCVCASLSIEIWRANYCSRAQQKKQQLHDHETGTFPEHSKEDMVTDRYALDEYRNTTDLDVKCTNWVGK